jgi:hypothetical protein
MCSAPPPAGSELDAAAVTVWHLKSGAWQSVAGPIRIRRPMRDSVWQALGPDQQAGAWHETSLPTWPGSSCGPDQCEPDEVMCSAVQDLPAARRHCACWASFGFQAWMAVIITVAEEPLGAATLAICEGLDVCV